MTQHTCKRCGYSTQVSTNLVRHLTKTYPCVPTNSDCQFNRDDLLKEFKQGRRGYATRPVHVASPSIVYNNNILVYNQFVGVVPKDFGDENVRTAVIDSGRYLKQCPDILEMVRNIHYNPEHPEHQNVCVTNVKDDIAYVVKNSEFRPASARECATVFLKKAQRLMDIYLSWNEEDLPEEAMQPWKDFIGLMADAFNPSLHLTEKEKKEIHKRVQEKINEVLHIMRYESRRIWPQGMRDLLMAAE